MGTLSGIGTAANAANALSGGVNAYVGYKGLGLAEDQFAFEKALANANFANQSKLVNNSIQNSGEVGMSLAGNSMSPEQRAARQAQVNANKIKTTI